MDEEWKYSKEDAWVLIETFIREHGLVRQHLDSYNKFVEKTLQEIINEVGSVESGIPGLKVVFGKITVGNPRVKEADGSESSILPMEARLRNLTYAAPLFLEMILVEEGEEKDRATIYIGDLPIMVKSVKCPLSKMSREEQVKVGEDPKDPGGYFIVNGSERVLIVQEDLAVNRILVDYGPTGGSVTHVAKVFSSTAAYRIPVTVERTKDGQFYVSFPSIPSRVPLVVMMRALGLESDREIVNAITSDPEILNELYPSLLEQSRIAMTIDDALDYIGARVAVGQPKNVRLERAQQVIDQYFLPHLGTKPENRLDKAYFLGQMVERLIELVLGRRSPDDKDHLANKRFKLAGDLMASVFRQAFKQFVKDLGYQLEKSRGKTREINLLTLARADVITDKLRSALATGNWPGGRTGVSQILDRTNYLSTISHLRRVVSPLSRTQPHFEARELHATHWGMLCPVESPEGQNCGLVKNLALLAMISIGIDEESISDVLVNKLGVIPIREAREKGISGTKVYVNMKLIGLHENGDALAKIIRELRRQGKIHHEVNVVRYKTEKIDEIYINCDGGRIRRSLLVVENGKLKLRKQDIEKLKSGEWSWSDLVRRGIVEYLDPEEEENALIAPSIDEVNEETTHLEISPAAILGVVASVIPYPEHNQSPRNSYEAAMAKQALGFSMANFLHRMDPRMHFLHYPQKALVRTRVFDLVELDERPFGQNVIVAVLTGAGYNIQDAIVINKAAIERGLARSTFFRTYETVETKYPGGQEDRIEVPSDDVMGYRSKEAYIKLDPRDGIVFPESDVKGGEVIIGKTSPPRFISSFFEPRATTRRRDTSISIRPSESGIADRVVIAEDADGNRLVKVRVRDPRIPELGDKFASRHGQKGVIGLILPAEDMPFTEDGVVPDILINPHAIPSRMTVGQLLESLAGKVASLTGRTIDATAFEGTPEEQLRELLHTLGFRSDGKEVLYNGVTGERLEAEIFIGVVYYQKLHHMVADKIHARARGRVQILTRQPTEGRAREGGLRFGEMEKDCLVGHGASILLRERLFESSDKTVIFVCNNCGFLGWYDARKNEPTCPICRDKSELYPIYVSYAFKLLLQELMSLGIAPKLILKDKVEVV
ncbi:MAG: DNA-directed RNA polymerase subunit B [Thermofilaceae archaeon]